MHQQLFVHEPVSIIKHIIMKSLAKCILSAILLLTPIYATARQTFCLNSGWKIDNRQVVTLPHAWNEDDAFRVGIKEMRDSIVVYTKTFRLETAQLQGKRVIIEFEGARQMADVYVNGNHVGMHENGVMAFGWDITTYVKAGENEIRVVTDNNWRYREKRSNSAFQWNDSNFNANYGGLTKNVWLHIVPEVFQTFNLWSNLGTTGIYIYGKDYDIKKKTATIHAESQVINTTGAEMTLAYEVEVADTEGRQMARFTGKKKTVKPGKCVTLSAEKRVKGLHFWSWGYGYLYRVTTRVKDTKGNTIDEACTTTGFRKAEFKQGMVWLNDRVMQVHGYAQRTSNEWPGVGMSVPPWLSDYSNKLLVESGGNVVRWMHVCPWRQDVESCDRVGLIQAMPAGDAERDVSDIRWTHRTALMRDAIIYFRNNPSILFYECGNKGISREHMLEMKQIRDTYDPYGMRAIGSREMLDRPEAEYGGEMLYVNKSDTKPMWMMEYCRDEGLRWYWNAWSYPYHPEGEGPLYRNADASAYNHNQDEFTAELVRRWYDYWRERPGTGTKVNAGGVKIIFSDTQTHGRSADNYRVSGVVDPMRIPKDGFYAHQVMWDGWVDDLQPHTYIVGHWDYPQGFHIPTVYVVSNADSVCLKVGNKNVKAGRHSHRFLWTFKDVEVTDNSLKAIGLNKNGEPVSEHTISKPGTPDKLRLTPILNPTGWKADGADVALVEVEVTDKDGNRCPLANQLVTYTLEGAAEWRGGVAKGFENHALCYTLPVECGVSRVMLRSLPTAGSVTLRASAPGIKDATLTLNTQAVTVTNGLSTHFPSEGLPCLLTRGETPKGPSFIGSNIEIPIRQVTAGSNQADATKSFDCMENTEWKSAANLDSAWICYTLERAERISEIVMKPTGFRATSYPLKVYAGDSLVWEGWTEKTLGFVHIPLKDCPASQQFTLRMAGSSTTRDAFGAVKELDSRNDEKKNTSSHALRILEIEFIKKL